MSTIEQQVTDAFNGKGWPAGKDGPSMLVDAAAEMGRLRAALREVYEVWAGSDGMVPATAAEAYQERLILQMRDAAARGLGMTASPPTSGQP